MSKIFNRVLTAKNQGLPEDRQANARENIGVYSKDEIDQLIGEFGGFKIAPSDAEGHPDVSDKNPKIIYLVQVDGATEPDLYREWIWATDEETGVYDWVCIGDTSADLSDMARKSEMSVTESGDRTAVQLADGISATVLNEHQDISGKADKATTLGGYGITDAHITDNVITLGDATVDMGLYASAEGLAGEVSRATAKEDELAGAIAGEASRATAEETALGETISAEVTRATGAEEDLNTTIANETTRAKEAESSLGVRITAETTRAEGAEADLNTAIANEAARAQEAETSLEANIASEANRAASVEAGLEEAIGAEATRATAAEADLSDSLDDRYTKAETDDLLTGKQDVISDLETIRSGATAGATAYQKPNTGIPSSDMTATVQASLGLADSAVQPAAIDAINEKIPASASASNQLVTASDLPDLSGYVMEAAAPLKIVDGTNGKKVTNNGADLTVTGTNAWAEGCESVASGALSHAEGHSTASGTAAHSEGSDGTRASGTAAHGEGIASVASGWGSHAENKSTASGMFSHSEGEGTVADGNWTHAQGCGTVATGDYACAIGKYNNDSTGLLVVGNGVNDNGAITRSDCFKVDTSGDTHVIIGNTLTNLNEYLTPGDDDLITVTIPNTALVGGRLYRTCIIGSQEWLAENLDWKFPGCTIGDPYSTEPGARANYYDNDEATYGENGNKYGLLYNWYCVSILNSLLSDGWRVPSDYDWEALKNREYTIGKQLKATSGWNADNGTDVFGFRGLPSGTYEGTFTGIGDTARFMSSTDHGSYLYEYSLNDSNVFSFPDVLYYVGGISYAKERTIRLVRTVV